MRNLLARLRNRWRYHVGDRPLGAAIRREIVALGFARSTVRVRDLRLAAVERPGYRQLYRFEAEAESHDDHRAASLLFGVSREDPRTTRIDVHIAHDRDERDRVFAEWSDGMITLESMRGRERSRFELVLLAAFAVAITIATIGAILGN